MVWVEEMRHCGRISGTSYLYFEFLLVLAKHVVHEWSVEVAIVVSGLGMRLYYNVYKSGIDRARMLFRLMPEVLVT